MLRLLSLPYLVIAPVVPWLLGAALTLLVVCAARALRQAAVASSALLASAAIFLATRWLLAAGSFASVMAVQVGTVLFLVAVVAAMDTRRLPVDRSPRLPLWPGIAVAVLALGLKCVALADWPPHLNAYSAENGWRGIQALEGIWPADLFGGQEYDLVNGGVSPLHLPILWASMRVFGGGIFALRFAEVVASTLLLLVLWVWIRERVRGGWGLLALAVFAVSPWHLAQSRMGTFFSISAALGVLLLWLAEKLVARREPSIAGFVGLGFCAGLIGYAYAPLGVLYLFYFAVLLGAGLTGRRRRLRDWWSGPLLSASCLAAVVAVQVGVPPRLDRVIRQDFGTLATDASILRKTPAGEVTATLQPPGVVVENAEANLVTWFRRTWQEPNILVWYAPVLTVVLPAALVLLVSPGFRVVALYFLIGALPPLLVFPVQRRTLILWPLVYVAGVVIARELSRACARLVDRNWWRRGCTGVVLGCIAVASVHGVRVYATTNSIVRTGTYFGPDYRLDMLLAAERLLPRCIVSFVNATTEEELVARVRLYEPLRHGGEIEFVEVGDGRVEPSPRPGMAHCFVVLEKPDEESTAIEDLVRLYPGGATLRIRSDRELNVLYTVYQLAADRVSQHE